MASGRTISVPSVFSCSTAHVDSCADVRVVTHDKIDSWIDFQQACLDRLSDLSELGIPSVLADIPL
jgi:hypothetical protein